MKNIYCLIFLFLCFVSCKKNTDPGNGPILPDGELKNYNKDITIVNWNIEWFGDAQGFHGNLNVQEANAGAILKYLNADMYIICEVVDTARFGRMVRQTLGDEFRYAISPYSTIDQKLAFVYNRHIFRSVSTRPFMGLSATAYINFSNGRFPFLFESDVTVNGNHHTISFIALHAKANQLNNDEASYQKRLNGSLEMKDSLDAYFKQKYFMVLGDYNDNFNGSINIGKTSPYQNILNDNTNYTAITLPLNSPGNQSTLGYANSVIDQQVVSSNMIQWYKNNSIAIRTDVTTVVPDYSSGNTSDHYPVSSILSIK